MVFSSALFLFGYLPLALVLYFVMPSKYKNGMLFALSLLFYGWEEPVYILVMLLSVTVAYLLAFPIGKYRESKKNTARAYLSLSVALNLLPLLFFKYTNFFLQNLALIPTLAPILRPVDGLTLPVGISFYTFQIISYSVDVYRGDVPAQKNYVSFGAYVALFPQLVAGPILRYRDVDKQLSARTHSVEKFAAGIRRFTVGLGKKLLLGDTLSALYAYLSTAADFTPSVLGGWGMVLAYTLHIYYDFSGYSDMAIGLGKMLGFDFPENFNYPYVASSVTDFWRRWHISLSSWFREYVYIPLGGNRKGLPRQMLNMAVVWLLTGLWHGAAWNFVLWGLLFFVLLTAEKLFLGRLFRKNQLTAALGRIWTLASVGVGWMLFDHTDLAQALRVILSLVGVSAVGRIPPAVGYELTRALPLLVIGIIGATPFPAKAWRGLRDKLPAAEMAQPALVLALLVLSVAAMVSGAYSPFLYFNF